MVAAEAVAVSAIQTYNFNVFFKFIQPFSPVLAKTVPAGIRRASHAFSRQRVEQYLASARIAADKCAQALAMLVFTELKLIILYRLLPRSS
jgi:hypothetical protein